MASMPVRCESPRTALCCALVQRMSVWMTTAIAWHCKLRALLHEIYTISLEKYRNKNVKNVFFFLQKNKKKRAQRRMKNRTFYLMHAMTQFSVSYFFHIHHFFSRSTCI